MIGQSSLQANVPTEECVTTPLKSAHHRRSALAHDRVKSSSKQSIQTKHNVELRDVFIKKTIGFREISTGPSIGLAWGPKTISPLGDIFFYDNFFFKKKTSIFSSAIIRHPGKSILWFYPWNNEKNIQLLIFNNFEICYFL